MATTPTQARVYIVRHGETEANRQGIIQGQMDTALNEVGVEQARMVGEFLKGVRFDRALSSDLSRATKVCGFIIGMELC
jgi:probable phosphoglycerate mutase